MSARASRYPRKDPEQARFYGSKEWKQTRARVKREEPVCRICRANPTSTVDHIDGDYRNRARSNLRGLCGTCEASRTGRQHRAKQGPFSDRPEKGCDEHGVPLDPGHHWR